MGGPRRLGKIAAAVRAYAAWPSAFTYDFACLGFTPQDVGKKLTWQQAGWLVEELLNRPDSALGAAYSGMEYPITRADATLRDFIDLFISANSSKRRGEKYPRPFKIENPESGSRLGNTDNLPQAQVRNQLQASAPTRTI